jgi:DNA repair protein RecO
VILIHDDALVIDSIPYRDRDVILSLLTPSTGVIRGVFRGARGGKHPSAGSTQILSLVHMTAFQSPHAEMATMRQVELRISSFPLSKDLRRSAAAAVAAELMATFCPQGEPAPRRFRLGVAGLKGLLGGSEPETVVAYLQFWSLVLAGLMPPLEDTGLDAKGLEFLLHCRSRPVSTVTDPPPRQVSLWLDRAVRSAAERPLRALDFLRTTVDHSR